MPAKKYESLRAKEGNRFITRLCVTQPLIDEKWIRAFSLNRSVLKKYLIVQYEKGHDKWIPEWKNDHVGISKKVAWWHPETHQKLKGEMGHYDDSWDRGKKDEKKAEKARELFVLHCSWKKSFQTDDWIEAQEKYIEWCKTDGAEVYPLEIESGGKIKCGDD